jgi:hypothetical protein
MDMAETATLLLSEKWIELYSNDVSPMEKDLCHIVLHQVAHYDPDTKDTTGNIKA